jgi:hypothetical protein
MTAEKITHRECEKARLESFSPMRNKPFFVIIVLVSLLMIPAAFPVPAGFADFYHKFIYIPYISVTLPIFDLIPPSLDMLTYAIMFLSIATLLLAIFTIIRFFTRKKSSKLEIILFYIVVAGFICVAFLLNHVKVLDYTSSIEQRMGFEDKEFTDAEKAAFAEIVVAHLNELSVQVPRDENGNFHIEKYDMTVYKDALRNISDKVPYINGYYTTPLIPPDALEMLVLYSFEALEDPTFHTIIYSDYTSDLTFGVTPPHEIAHSQGYIREEEASFIGALACIKSDDVSLQYSGWAQLYESLTKFADEGDPIRDESRLSDEYLRDVQYTLDQNAATVAEFCELKGITREQLVKQKYGDATDDEIDSQVEELYAPYIKDATMIMAYFEAYPDEFE